MSPEGIQKRGFTLIELLVVIAIIAVLISILLPALYMARNEGQSAKCQANLRSIVQCVALYMDDQEGSKLLPWYKFPPYNGYSQVNFFTPWVFGGSKSVVPDNDGWTGDYELYPAEIRPLNKFVDPGKYGNAIIDLYIDPGDRTHRTSVIGSGDIPLDEEQYASWESNGSSYTLQTRWAQGYALPSGNWVPDDFDPANGEACFNAKIAKHMIGGEAAELIFYVEQGFYSACYRAGPTPVGIGGGPCPQRFGWHRKWSTWNVAFLDGHVRSGYFDTRQIYGLGGTIWQPRYHPPGY